MNEAYEGIAALVGIVTFLACWAYAIARFGFLLGVGLGWIPAFFIAEIVGVLWPVLLVVAIGAALLLGLLIGVTHH